MLKLLICLTCFLRFTEVASLKGAANGSIIAIEVSPIQVPPRYVLTLKDEDICQGTAIILCPMVEHKPTQLFQVINDTFIRSVYSGYYLTIDPQMNEETDLNKIALTTQPFHGKEGQKWLISANNESLSIAEGKWCMDIYKGKPTRAAPVIFQPCDESSPSQHFDAGYDNEKMKKMKIISIVAYPYTLPLLVLTVKDENFCEGTEIILCPHIPNKPSQLFVALEEYYSNVISGYYITADVESESGPLTLRPFIYFGDLISSGQRWHHTDNTTILNLDFADGCVDIEGGKPYVGAKVIHRPCNGANSQKFSTAIELSSNFTSAKKLP
ncbi:hypothetical protein CHUAL_007694 [Chamberlinius hualienensis]